MALSSRKRQRICSRGSLCKLQILLEGSLQAIPDPCICVGCLEKPRSLCSHVHHFLTGLWAGGWRVRVMCPNICTYRFTPGLWPVSHLWNMVVGTWLCWHVPPSSLYAPIPLLFLTCKAPRDGEGDDAKAGHEFSQVKAMVSWAHFHGGILVGFKKETRLKDLFCNP